MASVFNVIVFGLGLTKARKNGTNTWLEMLNVVMGGVFWVFMVLFTIIIFAAIFYLFEVTFEKVRGAFVAWDNSELWCIKIEHRFEEDNRSIEELQHSCQDLQHTSDDLAYKIERLYNMYCELKKLTGADVKKIEMDAEREITQGA